MPDQGLKFKGNEPKGKYGDAQNRETIALNPKSRGVSMAQAKYEDVHGTAQWESIMRKFSQSHKEICKNLPSDIPLGERSKKTFPTGSTYAGSWNTLGMSGEGTYVFPYEGVKYVGGFDDGMFHGEGELQYDCGAVIRGKWNKGELIEKHLFFSDGLEYQESNWAYCRVPDRRFTNEYDFGLEPAGRSYLTAEQPTPEVPPGFYDVGSRFYDDDSKTLYKYNDINAIVGAPSELEQKWIVKNCRTSPDLPKGPCNFLYEEWQKPKLESDLPPLPPVRCNTHQEEEEEGGQLDTSCKSTSSGTDPSSTTHRGRLSTIPIGLDSNYFYRPSCNYEAIEAQRASTMSIGEKNRRSLKTRESAIFDTSRNRASRATLEISRTSVGDPNKFYRPSLLNQGDLANKSVRPSGVSLPNIMTRPSMNDPSKLKRHSATDTTPSKEKRSVKMTATDPIVINEP